MKIPNYDCQDPITNFKQLHPFMPDRTFRMLICGPSGSGKTNVLLDMIFRLLFYDKIYLYAKNLDQTKYQRLLKTFHPISKEAGYDVVEASSDEIIPVLNCQGRIKSWLFSMILFPKRTKSRWLIISFRADTRIVP